MRKRIITSMALVAVVALGACSTSSTPEEAPAADTTTAAAPTETASSEVTEGPAIYTAREYSFDGPDTLPVGTSDIVMKNEGAVEHELVIIRLDENQDWTQEQFVEYVANDPKDQPAWAVPVAGAFPPAKPGGEASVVFMDFSKGQPKPIEGGSLEAGSYAFMCFVANPGEKMPHAGLGMVKTVTVS